MNTKLFCFFCGYKKKDNRRYEINLILIYISDIIEKSSKNLKFQTNEPNENQKPKEPTTGSLNPTSSSNSEVRTSKHFHKVIVLKYSWYNSKTLMTRLDC